MPVLAAPIFELNDHAYLRWPLPAGAASYRRIDGFAMKPYVKTLVDIAERSRKDGHQWWGRITGTPYHDETQEWVADQFRRIGLEVRTQRFDLMPVWFPKSWEMTASSGGESLTLKTAQPVLRSPGTPAGGLEAEAAYVGLGSAAEFMNRELKGKVVFVYSVPQPGALRHSASAEAVQRSHAAGAAAVVMVLALPGNVTAQLWGLGDEEQILNPIPTFSMGLEDGMRVRELIEQRQPVKVRVKLDVEVRDGLKPSAVFGTLAGTTDENILILAHPDGFFQGAVDNASGVAVMLGLAEYFSRTPKQNRRRTIRFMSPIGHHVSRDVSLEWMRDHNPELWAKTALVINCEHTATTQFIQFDRVLVRTNAATGHRFKVVRSKRVGEILFKAFSLFGVPLWEAPQIRPSGDLHYLEELAPGIEVIESNEPYHSDLDVNTVPSAGLEGIARAYAKIVDEVNRVDLKDLVDPPAPAGVRGR